MYENCNDLFMHILVFKKIPRGNPRKHSSLFFSKNGIDVLQTQEVEVFVTLIVKSTNFLPVLIIS